MAKLANKEPNHENQNDFVDSVYRHSARARGVADAIASGPDGHGARRGETDSRCCSS